MVFFGITERQEEMQVMFEIMFNLHFKKNFKLQEQTRVSNLDIDDETIEEIKRINHLVSDVQLLPSRPGLLGSWLQTPSKPLMGSRPQYCCTAASNNEGCDNSVLLYCEGVIMDSVCITLC